MLMNHTDTQVDGILGGMDDSLFALQIDASGVRLVNARKHVHQRGFARAVFTQQCQDFAPVHHQIDVVIGFDAAKGLG
jgi:hypothetical protein